MLRLLRFSTRPGAVQCNCLAGFICLMALGIVLLNFKGTPAGAGSSTASRLAVAAVAPAPEKDLGSKVADLGNLNAAIRSSRVALLLHIAQLELGLQRLQACPAYTCKFTKQEVLAEGEPLHDPQTMLLKLRHQPFSVYMKWEEGGDVGREVLFCENENDRKLLVKLGGIKRALPTVKLEPTSSMAMAESRHPITQAGMKYVVEQALSFRRGDLEKKTGTQWQLLSDQKFDGRPCDVFVALHDAPSTSCPYRKSEMFIDRELSLPVCIRNYGWPSDNCDTSDASKLDEQTLFEIYAYSDIQLNPPQLSDADFSKTNKAYKFKR